MKRVAVFASGRGSNLAALIAGQTSFSSYRIALVVSNRAAAGALSIAKQAGIPARDIPSRGVKRQEHEIANLASLAAESIDILCLAGYMRVLSPSFIEAFDKPILNIHPSLLPAFPGMHAQKQALDAGVRWSGATVHFVDSGMDTGPIILQEPVPILEDDTEDSLSGRILEIEHRLFPQALDTVARNNYQIRGRKVFFGLGHSQ